LIDPGALLARTWRLDDGFRVRLRLARCGVEVTELEVSRLVRPDPRREVTICAAAPVDGTEEVVGVGSISYDDPDATRIVACDERMRAGGERLLDDALRELVRRRARRVA
jgi:hypothetical protein